MNLQVLISTMNQHNHALLKKMNIQTDAIVVNQCEQNVVEEFDYNGNKIKFLSFAEKGVGLSRNNALIRATGDIVLFADDDVTYVNGYEEIILREFRNNPQFHMIIFNLNEENSERPSVYIRKPHRVHFYNCLRYGTYRIAVRTESIRIVNIHFSLIFGGGTKYGSGEDSIFILECIKKGLKIWASPHFIGSVSHKESTWFQGYTDKYFFDKGVNNYCLSSKFAKLICLRHVIKHRKLFSKEKTPIEALKLMIAGVDSMKKNLNRRM